MLLLGQIVQALAADFQAHLIGPADLEITALAPIETAAAGQLSFVAHPKYQSKLAQSRAGCVVVSPALQALALERGAAIVVDQPYLYFARVTQLWKQRHARPTRSDLAALPVRFFAGAARLAPSSLGS